MAHMTPEQEKTLMLHLERDIDRFGLSKVLDVLENVCYAKAEHLRVNWQDESAAKRWEKIGQRLGRVPSSMVS